MRPMADKEILRKINKTFDATAEKGRLGYVLAWAMGVPASILLLIFLVRGH